MEINYKVVQNANGNTQNYKHLKIVKVAYSINTIKIHHVSRTVYWEESDDMIQVTILGL